MSTIHDPVQRVLSVRGRPAAWRSWRAPNCRPEAASLACLSADLRIQQIGKWISVAQPIQNSLLTAHANQIGQRLVDGVLLGPTDQLLCPRQHVVVDVHQNLRHRRPSDSYIPEYIRNRVSNGPDAAGSASRPPDAAGCGCRCWRSAIAARGRSAPRARYRAAEV